jgi:hypothetical protein
MLSISQSKEIPPYFYDEDGNPDIFPVQFTDRETGYCRPFPHWNLKLTKQVEWVPTYLRFRTTILEDGTGLSTKLLEMKDIKIVQLLLDGPFRTAQNKWRTLGKSDAEHEELRSKARRQRRIDNVSPICKSSHTRLTFVWALGKQ